MANPTIDYLIVAGRDPGGHRSGQTLLALAKCGVDEHMRVIDSVGKRPIQRNVTRTEVEAFRRQVETIDLIGCDDADRIVATIEKLSAVHSSIQPGTCSCSDACSTAETPTSLAAEIISVRPPELVEMDRAGYFVIIPDAKRQLIVVEHYAYDNQLQHVVEGTNSGSLYSTIIERGWITQLSHAAYLGRELARAELSLKSSFTYVQDRD